MQKYSTLKAKLIYIFTVPDAAHQGCVKVGEATLEDGFNFGLQPNSSELNQAARKRIDQYTKTVGVKYILRHTELAVSVHGGFIGSFNDKDVHNVLLRSGVKKHDFSDRSQGTEWFDCSVETAVAAIQAVKEGRFSIKPEEMVPIDESIEFRPEQQDAIDRTLAKFRSGGKMMLWNAKMRFGKTLTALQVVKELRCHRTIIITHRPVVDKGWFEDFHKIFTMLDPYTYGSREKGEPFHILETFAKKNPDQHYIYFASMQDLRGAEIAGGKFDKNAAIFKAPYDMLIIDEAHEGTQTELGQNVINLLTKENTKVLKLSGTPFNLMEQFKEDEIYTWDYVMEQKAKADWDKYHFGDPNPYAGLPKLHIYTFDIGKALSGFEDIEDSAFNFKEFFRTWTGDPEKDHRPMPEGAEGKFIHEEHVKSFLDLIVKYDPESNYPFSTEDFRNSFRHTLWMVPGVKEARALSTMLKNHPIFGMFDIVNVAGDGDEEVENDNALKLVEKAMGGNPEETRTITLSCGKLTTGVTVKPWTAVMMLAGSHNTDAKAYMQTIFRVQSPYTAENGFRKENCYVFDFAPDRTLKVLADTARVQTKNTATESDRAKLGAFLNFCPVIGYNGTKMAQYNVESMLEQLKRAYISRVTRNGCDDDRLYNQEMLRKLDPEALAKFKNLHAIIGATKANHASTDVDMAKAGLTNEQYEELERIQKKPKKERTPEELAALEEAKEKKKNADSAISILRGISIRLPLLMYGAELKDEGQDITLENFADLIDNQSWEEFMPRGVTKELFAEFIPYYDPDMFRAVSRNYRDLVREADKLAPMERTREVARIFSYFRNPDKETVLTPWRVVNMHIGDCIGGQVFYDTDMETEAVKPRFVDHGEVTAKVFKDPGTRILEINSKTGLYPLYMTYSVFAEKLQAYRESHMLPNEVSKEVQNQIWDDVLRNHIFVICKTEMAKSITKRTLRGFRSAKVNARYFEDLVNKITNQPQLFLTKVKNGINYWNNNTLENDMKFNAIVGNPPYQQMGGSGGTNDASIFQLFCGIATKLAPEYVSMIIPSKWFSGGRDNLLKPFREAMLSGGHLMKLVAYADSSDIFSNVEIKGGICYYLEDAKYKGDCEYTLVKDGKTETREMSLNSFDILIRDPQLAAIVKKVQSTTPDGTRFVDTLISSDTPFGVPTNPKDSKKSPFAVSDVQNAEFSLPLLYLEKGTRKYGYVRKADIKKNAQDIPSPKVFIPKAGGSGNDMMILGQPEVAKKNAICSQTFLYAKFESEEAAHNFAIYLRTKFFRILVSAAKITQDAPSGVYRFVPLLDLTRTWTDAELYKHYQFTKEEIAYVESMIKPMGGESLFNPEDLIDANFGEFNLAEHGVRVGDKIVYTPTDMELTVAEDNMVEYEGELYTLANFTAKYMPRNKRSVSGVCQGPKYFSFKGVSLYQMKESFLGGANSK